VLQKLSEQIRACYERAAEAHGKAEESADPALKADFLALEQRWLVLARSYAFTDSRAFRRYCSASIGSALQRFPHNSQMMVGHKRSVK